MSTSETTTGYAAEWLALREGADAAARAADLVGLLLPRLPTPPLIVRDLGCGTGAMGRWLAGRLPGPQRWILHDRDPGLLALAATGMSGTAAADGRSVRVMVEQGDIGGLRSADLVGTSLVTASALLDVLSVDEAAGLAAACVAARTPALLALTVVGHVEFAPADPLDAVLAAAFDDHQRRTRGGRRLLGPDAAGVTAAAFERLGAVVHTRPSPWRLGTEQAALTAHWLRGWVAAAVEQRQELAAAADDYLRRRLAACAAGGLRVVIGHADLLALPGGG